MDLSSDLRGIGEQSLPRQQKHPVQNGKIKKSSSFNEQYRRKHRTPKRNTHTVPSDKDENERIEHHRRECLSKAIQWNTADLIKQSESFQADRAHIRDALTCEELKQLERFKDRKRKFRIFLCFLKRKTFVIMQTWLLNCGLDEDIIKKVWEAYGEFNNQVTNEKKMKCFSCRLSSMYSVTVVADHLHSAEIIDDLLYETIIKSDLPVGLQIQLWKAIFRQCAAYTIPIHVVGAFEIALRESLEDKDIPKVDIEALLTELETLKDGSECFLNCYCSKICAKALHPLSCVRTMPISQVYFRKSSPPKSDSTAAAKSLVDANSNSYESSDGGNGFISSPSCTSDDTGAEGDCDSPQSSSSLSSTELVSKYMDTGATRYRKRCDNKNGETSSYSRYETAAVASGQEDIRPIYGSATRKSRSVMPTDGPSGQENDRRPIYGSAALKSRSVTPTDGPSGQENDRRPIYGSAARKSRSVMPTDGPSGQENERRPIYGSAARKSRSVMPTDEPSGEENERRLIYGSAARKSRSVTPTDGRKLDKIAQTNHMISKKIEFGCLKLHGILSLLQENIDEGMTILSMSKYPSADKVMELFAPTFSKNQEEKEIEELIIYHWNIFLKNVERGNISTNWLDLSEGEDITESIVTMNMGHVLQALIGCRRLPTNMMKGAGTIEFDHIQSRLTTANTCAPSLCFASTKLLQDYQELENHIIHIITETDGFGIV